MIGKVLLSRKDMLSMNPSTGECWYSLVDVDSASEVHGALHLTILPVACVSLLMLTIVTEWESLQCNTAYKIVVVINCLEHRQGTN